MNNKLEKEPLVSILIPLYNSEAYVVETLDSCINQTYRNIEIIVVDDGSSDNSLRIVQDYAKNHSQVKVYTQPNGGACKARNLAFEKSSGEYIMYLDADDLMSENKIQNQINSLIEYNDHLIVATCPFEEFETVLPENKEKRSHYRDYDNPTDLLVEMWGKGSMFPVTCYMIHREMVALVGDWDERLRKNQDGDYFSRVLMKARFVCFCGESCFYYRRGHISISTTNKNSQEKLSSVLLTYEKQLAILKIRNDKAVRKAMARNFSLIANSAEYNSDLYLRAIKNINELNEKLVVINPTILVDIFTTIFSVNIYLKLKAVIHSKYGLKT